MLRSKPLGSKQKSYNGASSVAKITGTQCGELFRESGNFQVHNGQLSGWQGGRNLGALVASALRLPGELTEMLGRKTGILSSKSMYCPLEVHWNSTSSVHHDLNIKYFFRPFPSYLQRIFFLCHYVLSITKLQPLICCFNQDVPPSWKTTCGQHSEKQEPSSTSIYMRRWMAWMPKRKYSIPSSSHWFKHMVRRTASGENMMFGRAQCNCKKHLALEVLAGEKKLPHFWSHHRFPQLLVDRLFSAVKKRTLKLEAR